MAVVVVGGAVRIALLWRRRTVSTRMTGGRRGLGLVGRGSPCLHYTIARVDRVCQVSRSVLLASSVPKKVDHACSVARFPQPK